MGGNKDFLNKFKIWQTQYEIDANNYYDKMNFLKIMYAKIHLRIYRQSTFNLKRKCFLNEKAARE